MFLFLINEWLMHPSVQWSNYLASWFITFGSLQNGVILLTFHIFSHIKIKHKHHKQMTAAESDTILYSVQVLWHLFPPGCTDQHGSP